MLITLNGHRAEVGSGHLADLLDEVLPPPTGERGVAVALNGEVVQDSRTSDLIFSVPVLIDRLSSICPLLPGDLIFTGTPSGVGMARTPPRYLQPGDELVSTIEGIGSMRTSLAARWLEGGRSRPPSPVL